MSGIALFHDPYESFEFRWVEPTSVEPTHVAFTVAEAAALVDVAEAARKRDLGWGEREIDELRAALDRLDAARQQGVLP